MHQDAADRLEFAPPPPRDLASALVLALAAHLLLLAALTWGINWRRESQDIVAEAELWSSVPRQAAPKAVQAPPPPEPTPVVPRAVDPPPAPVTAPKPPPDIAVEREKQMAQARREKEAQQREKEKQAKLEAERKLAQLREQNLQRIQGMAGASNSPSATGAADRAAGPSASWAGRIRARVKPNIVFTDEVGGNPTAEVEVRMAPDGTITGKQLVKSSGSKPWDDAVLRALDKTEVLPRDVDGRIHSPVIISFRLRD